MQDLQDFSEPPTEHPKLTAINAQLRERQEAQQAREKQVKTELVQKATSYLEDFYKVSRASFGATTPQSLYWSADKEQGVFVIERSFSGLGALIRLCPYPLSTYSIHTGVLAWFLLQPSLWNCSPKLLQAEQIRKPWTRKQALCRATPRIQLTGSVLPAKTDSISGHQ